MGKIIRDHEELKRALDAEKARGKTIVFTNGSFDLMHVGHVRALADCKKHADILVVAVNSDASVRGYKNPELPIVPENERMEVVAAMGDVDYVTIFSDLTADAILDYLRPDVQAKGTDYTEETVPERDTVLSYGGRIAIVGDPKDHSSTDIIATIRKRFGAGE
ncbi:MAG: adenylyltransferase/cytidyltransferase family protein [Planctomycetota bacterium]|jgi:rfaE bifunctional protein nucleotidyltransferase chain/domain